MTPTALVLLTYLAQASPVTASPQQKAQAQGLLKEGSALYERGDYAAALDKFNEAYAAYASPKLMFNIGQVNRDLGRPVEALEAFEKFLAGAGDASAETRAGAQSAVAELQKKLGRMRIECATPGADISVDGKPVGLTPLANLVWATPGRHQVTASHTSATPAIVNVDVNAGSVHTVTMRLRSLGASSAAAPAPASKPAPDFELQAAPPSGPSPAGADQGWFLGRKWTWVGAGSTVLLAAGAITAGLSMQSRFDSLDSFCGSGSPARPGCSESDISSVSSRKTMANVLWGLTAAAAVTTGALFFVEGSPVTVAPMAGETTGLFAGVRY